MAEGASARVGHGHASLDDAAVAAARILLEARRPLVYGLELSTVEAQRRAVEIADLIGGVIDPATSAGHVASQLTFAHAGQLSAMLGVVRERADLVVWWGIDPDASHPGFRARYVDPADGAPDRTTIAVDIGGARAPAKADVRLDVTADRELEVLVALYARLRHRRLEPARESRTPRWLQEVVEMLTVRLRACTCGVLFHDGDPGPGQRDPMRAEALATLALAAAPPARLRVIDVRRPGNGVGAETVLAWQTGYPMAVDFAAGHPSYRPFEHTADMLLARHECDAALVAGVDAVPDLSPAALAGLDAVPSIVVGPEDAWRGKGTRVRLVTPPYSELGGSVYRMDGVALRRECDYAGEPPDAAALGAIAEAVRRMLARPAAS